ADQRARRAVRLELRDPHERAVREVVVRGAEGRALRGGDRDVGGDQEPLVDRHPVGLGGRGEPLLALLQEQASHLAERERGDERERQERREDEEEEKAPGDVPALPRPRGPAHGSKSDASPMKPPSRARTMSSRLAEFTSEAAVWPSAPTLYRSKSELSGASFLSLRAWPFPLLVKRFRYWYERPHGSTRPAKPAASSESGNAPWLLIWARIFADMSPISVTACATRARSMYAWPMGTPIHSRITPMAITMTISTSVNPRSAMGQGSGFQPPEATERIAGRQRGNGPRFRALGREHAGIARIPAR